MATRAGDFSAMSYLVRKKHDTSVTWSTHVFIISSYQHMLTVDFFLWKRQGPWFVDWGILCYYLCVFLFSTHPQKFTPLVSDSCISLHLLSDHDIIQKLVLLFRVINAWYLDFYLPIEIRKGSYFGIYIYMSSFLGLLPKSSKSIS